MRNSNSQSLRFFLSYFARWIQSKLQEMGVEPGQQVEPEVRHQLDRLFAQTPLGYADTQALLAVQRLARSLLRHAVRSAEAVDAQALQWRRGEKVRFPELQKLGISEPVTDSNAFNRLRTVIHSLRKVLGYKGFLIAFDEGTRMGPFAGGQPRSARRSRTS